LWVKAGRSQLLSGSTRERRGKKRLGAGSGSKPLPVGVEERKETPCDGPRPNDEREGLIAPPALWETGLAKLAGMLMPGAPNGA
jgi:hypothetical protein